MDPFNPHGMMTAFELARELRAEERQSAYWLCENADPETFDWEGLDKSHVGMSMHDAKQVIDLVDRSLDRFPCPCGGKLRRAQR